MNKIAQRRTVWNKMRDLINNPVEHMTGGAAQEFFNPEFHDVVEKLKQVDSDARSIVAGKPLEGGNPGANPRAWKDIIKSAKGNLNRREFVAAVADLNRFHDKFKELLERLKEFDSKLNEIHHQFLTKDVDEEHLGEIKKMRGKWSADMDQKYQILKEAGAISDFLNSFRDPRLRALRFYENKYKNRVAPLRNGIANTIRAAEIALNKVLATLSEMASARATRNPDKYAGGINKILGIYGAYDAAFQGFYNSKLDKASGETVRSLLTKLVPEDIKSETTDTATPKGGEDDDSPSLSPQPGSSYPPSGAPPSGGEAPPSGGIVPAGQPSVEEENPQEFKSDRLLQEFRSDTNPAPPPSGPGVPGANPQVPSPHTTIMMGVAPPAGTPTTPPPSGPGRTVPYGDGVAIPPPPKVPQIVADHTNFYESLEAMSGEHPHIIASYISKYASLIQHNDPTTAIHLFKIAKSIRG